MGILSMPPLSMVFTRADKLSYDITFNGPSLKCEEASPELLVMINKVVEQVGDIAIYTAFTPALNADEESFAPFVRGCILGGDPCYFYPGIVSASTRSENGTVSETIYGRADPLIMRLDKSYTCALKNTSYAVRFHSSREQTILEPLSFKWQGMDPFDDIIYGAVGMAVAKILTGAYWLRKTSGGGFPGEGPRVWLESARTSIGSTALVGLLQQAMAEKSSKSYVAGFFGANSSYTTDITSEYPINVYAYNAFNLWVAYGAAILATLFSVGVGFYALFLNGVSHETRFSTIVATTRNHGLDELMAGCSLGADPMQKDVLQTRLRLGILRMDDNEGSDSRVPRGLKSGRAGFGLESQITPLSRRACRY
ncbi:hypothetical protein VTL71DRAFT_12437 [Oculimacula yallundae]|uniref:Uncharacterized protein n=1 Tax=Oculimacula yallundae TaxID=86028 RepID=A0ABR4CN33_9HELO